MNEQYVIDIQNMEKQFVEGGTFQKKQLNGADEDIKIMKSTGDAIPREP